MKKYWGILVASTLAACASNSTPPPESSASVAETSTTPTTGPDSPVANDATSSAPMHKEAAGSTGSDGPPSSSAPAADNAAAMPTQDTPASPPDNSRVNARDKGGKTLTPMDQGPSESDRKITQQIRQAVVKDGSLSFTAKNVKIITIDGKVTLRGPVKTAAERSSIEAAAKSVAGVGQVDNQLDVKN